MRQPIQCHHHATMAEDEGTAANPPPPPGDKEQQPRAPKISLKKPPTREDIPQLQSTVKLVNHDFSARQRQCLVKDPVVGPLYEAMMVRAEKKDKPSCVRHTCCVGCSRLRCLLRVSSCWESTAFTKWREGIYSSTLTGK